MVPKNTQENSVAKIWRELFFGWPTEFRRKGVVIPSFGENIAFADFVVKEDIVILERATPDSVGARRVAIPFALIETVKFTEPLKTEQFLENGYVTGLSATPPVEPVAN